MRKVVYAVTCLMAALLFGGSQFIMPIFEPPVAAVGTTTPFTPLHTFFVSATGNDSNSGTDTAHPWLTPHHNVSCGDVLLFQGSTNGAPVSYGQFSGSTGPGVVSGCASTTGGIDGTGGIHFAIMLCVGDVGSCKIDIGTPGIGTNDAILTSNSHWAVEGFGLTSGYSQSGSGCAGCIDTSAALVHHVAWINNVAWHNAMGFTVEGGGANGGYGDGTDYWAVVGNIVQDSAGRCDGFWTAAIPIIGTINSDTNAGTHVLVEGNFVLNSQQVGCSDFATTNGTTANGGTLLHFASVPADVQNFHGNFKVYDLSNPSAINGISISSTTATTVTLSSGTSAAIPSNESIQFSASVSDGESIMYDSIDCKDDFGGTNQDQFVISRNNITVVSERFGIHHFYDGSKTHEPVVKNYNNTIYASSQGNYSNDGGVGSYGELNLNIGNATVAKVYSYNNIGRTNITARPNDGGIPYALVSGNNAGTASNMVIGNTGTNPANSQNVFKGLATSCTGTCDSGSSPFNAVEFNSQLLGVNTYTDPTFNDTTDVLNNRIGTPNCATFSNTVACEGYNYLTQVKTNPSLIYGMTATAAGTSGKGYQPPSASCVASDPDFPTWLKGVVYLQASGWANGATITMNAGLITKPCGY